MQRNVEDMATERFVGTSCSPVVGLLLIILRLANLGNWEIWQVHSWKDMQVWCCILVIVLETVVWVR